MSCLDSFQTAVSVRTIVAKYKISKEFPSSDALKRYLDEHPKANPSNHSVQDAKSAPKMKRDDKSRWDSVLDTVKDLKGLGEKAKSGDKEAEKEVGKRLNALAEHATAASADAGAVLKKIKEGGGKLDPKAKQLEDALNKQRKVLHRLNNAKDVESQLRGAKELLDAASDVRSSMAPFIK